MTYPVIFLWGYMGAGKTRLGKRLSTKLGCSYLDLDEEIELQHQATVSEIFSNQGEEAFRNYEHQLILDLSKQENMVVSCGGGCPCWQNNKTIMNQQGITIFLQVQNDVLLQRLWENRDSRPLIAAMQSQDELREFVHNNYAERLPYYSQAQILYNNSFPKSDLSDLMQQIKELI